MTRVRTWIRRLHLAAAASAGLVLVVAGLSGSALVFRDELDAWLNPELLRVEPGARATSLERTLEAARSAYPQERVARLELARAAHESHLVVMSGEDPLQVYVDPYRGNVLGARRQSASLAQQLFEIHTTLLAGHTGERVMGATGLLLVLAAASGLWLWWPGIRRGLHGLLGGSRVYAGGNWKRTLFDLHRAIGIWSALLLAMSGLTGAALVFHEPAAAVLDRLTGSRPRIVPPRVQPLAGTAASADALVASGRASIPDLQAFYLIFPAGSGAPAVVRGRVPGELHPNGRNFAYLDPASGQAIEAERSREAPPGTRIYDTFYPLHIGRWGGLPSRLAYVLLGFTPLALGITGTAMWWNRSGRRLPGRLSRGRRPPGARRTGRQERTQRVA